MIHLTFTAGRRACGGRVLEAGHVHRQVGDLVLGDGGTEPQLEEVPDAPGDLVGVRPGLAQRGPDGG